MNDLTQAAAPAPIADKLMAMAEDKRKCYAATGNGQYLHESGAYDHASQIAREMAAAPQAVPVPARMSTLEVAACLPDGAEWGDMLTPLLARNIAEAARASCPAAAPGPMAACLERTRAAMVMLAALAGSKANAGVPWAALDAEARGLLAAHGPTDSHWSR